MCITAASMRGCWTIGQTQYHRRFMGKVAQQHQHLYYGVTAIVRLIHTFE
jgi:hypothetical protein